MPKRYTEEELQRAIAAKKNGMCYSVASKTFGIPQTTLVDHIKGRSKAGVKAGRKTSIPPEVEASIVEAIFRSAEAGFPLTKDQILKRVGKVVHKLNLKTQFVDGVPVDGYWRALKLRFPQITIRSAECCSHKRLSALSRERVASYFEDLHSLIRSNNIQPQAIWNMDETGLQFSHKPGKVVAKKGSRRLHQRCSDSKETVTIVAAINAAGRALIPMAIVKGKTEASVQSFDVHLGPDGCFWTYQEHGWTDNSIGLERFKSVFLPHCGSERPQLLLLDGHSSHEVLELLEIARDEDVHIFALPPHTTQCLQPLDTNVFKPMKTAYNSACTDFLFNYPSKVIDKHSFPLMLSRAWDVFGDGALLRKAFRTTGVYPPNPAAISDDWFTAFAALSRPLLEAGLSDASTSGGILVQAVDPEPESSTTITMKEAGPSDASTSGGILVQAVDPEPAPTLTQEAGSSSTAGVSGDILAQAMDMSWLTADWNETVNDIFSTPTTEPRPATIRRYETSHRVLTSDRIVDNKRRKREEKERMEAEKRERALARETKRKAAIDKGPQPKRSKTPQKN